MQVTSQCKIEWPALELILSASSFFIARKRILKQTEPILKTGQHKESFKCKKNQRLLSIYCSCRSVYQNERENPMVERMRCYEWFHQKCEKIIRKVFTSKAAISFVKNAATDLASFSWTFASGLKCQLLSPFGKIYYKTLSGFVFTLHCLFLNQFLAF